MEQLQRDHERRQPPPHEESLTVETGASENIDEADEPIDVDEMPPPFAPFPPSILDH